MKTFYLNIISLLMLSFFYGCAGSANMLTELKVDSRMSETIFLDPVDKKKRTVFLQIRNTSGKSGFSIAPRVKNLIQNKGYTVVDDPDKANYWLQANILNIITDKKGAEKTLAKGFSDTANKMMNGTNIDLSVDSLVRVGTEIVVTNMMNEVYFAVIADLQISERIKNGGNTLRSSGFSTRQGKRGYSTDYVHEVSNMKRYQTRILSEASRLNLQWKEASGVLSGNLANVISGLL